MTNVYTGNNNHFKQAFKQFVRNYPSYLSLAVMVRGIEDGNWMITINRELSDKKECVVDYLDYEAVINFIYKTLIEELLT